MILNYTEKYFSPFSIILLCALTFLNTYITFNEINFNIQITVIIFSIIIWFSYVGFQIKSAIFSAIALIPANLYLGQGLISFPGLALSLNDIFTLIAFFLFSIRPLKLHFNQFTYLLWLLFGISLLSIVITSNPLIFVGQLVRFFILILLISIILNSYGSTLKKSVFLALLVWPFISLSHLMGLNYFWTFLTFGNGAAFNSTTTGEVLLGSHIIVFHIYFLLPLFILLRVNKFFLFILLLYLSILTIYSQSRSLIISVGIAFFLYLYWFSSKKTTVNKLILTFIISILIVPGVIFLDFFNFGTNTDQSKHSSSYVRKAKIVAALKTYYENPILGIGFGAVGAIDSKREYKSNIHDPDFVYEQIDVKASAESSFPQILAETGSLGGMMCIILLILYFKSLRNLLTDFDISVSIKITQLCYFIIFMTSFLGSNSYSILPLMLAMPFILRRI